MTTLSDLMLAVSYAEDQERWHQAGCRARANADPCVSCMDREARWLRADTALRDFRAAQVAAGVA